MRYKTCSALTISLLMLSSSISSAISLASAAQSPSPKVRSDYISAGDALCLKGQKAVVKLGVMPLTKSTLQPWLQKVAIIQGNDLQKLKALKPPAGDIQVVNKIWGPLESAVKELSIYAKGLRTDSPETLKANFATLLSNFSVAGRNAQGYGFSVCGDSGLTRSSTPVTNTVTVTSSSNQIFPLQRSIHAISNFKQGDGKWGKILPSGQFAKVGNIPTIVANLLTGFGIDATPITAASALQASGAWSPVTGGNWGAVSAYIASLSPPGGAPLQVANTTLSAAASGLNSTAGNPPASLYIVAWTKPKGQDSQVADNFLYLLTNFKPKDDAFSALDPVSGQRTIKFLDLAKGNPWVLQISEPLG